MAAFFNLINVLLLIANFQFNFLTVSVALTPVPNVTPTASKAEIAISITSPAFRLTITLPL